MHEVMIQSLLVATFYGYVRKHNPLTFLGRMRSGRLYRRITYKSDQEHKLQYLYYGFINKSCMWETHAHTFQSENLT